MTRVVLDSNILVSAALWEEGAPARVFDLVREGGRLQLLLSDFILAETRRVLLSDKLTRFFPSGVDRNAFIDEYQGRLIASCIKVTVESIVHEIDEDPPDNHILACAFDGGAHYLVTSNERHFKKLGTWRGIKIMTPALFLAEVEVGPRP